MDVTKASLPLAACMLALAVLLLAALLAPVRTPGGLVGGCHDGGVATVGGADGGAPVFALSGSAGGCKSGHFGCASCVAVVAGIPVTQKPRAWPEAARGVALAAGRHPQSEPEPPRAAVVA